MTNSPEPPKWNFALWANRYWSLVLKNWGVGGGVGSKRPASLKGNLWVVFLPWVSTQNLRSRVGHDCSCISSWIRKCFPGVLALKAWGGGPWGRRWGLASRGRIRAPEKSPGEVGYQWRYSPAARETQNLRCQYHGPDHQRRQFAKRSHSCGVASAWAVQTSCVLQRMELEKWLRPFAAQRTGSGSKVSGAGVFIYWTFGLFDLIVTVTWFFILGIKSYLTYLFFFCFVL